MRELTWIALSQSNVVAIPLEGKKIEEKNPQFTCIVLINTAPPGKQDEREREREREGERERGRGGDSKVEVWLES